MHNSISNLVAANAIFFDYSSDCFINATPELISHLTQIIKTFLTHGYVPHFLLLCTLVPIVKDSLGDTQSSSNYRAIAISSLVMKLLDWVILLLEGDKLSMDQLQFGYQTNISTTMCSWAVSTVVEHYNIRNRNTKKQLKIWVSENISIRPWAKSLTFYLLFLLQ